MPLTITIAPTTLAESLLTQALQSLITGEVSRVKGWEALGHPDRAEPLPADEYFWMFRKRVAYAAIQLAAREFEERYEIRPDYCVDEVRVRPMQPSRTQHQLGCDWINQRVREILTAAGLAQIVLEVC